MLCKITYLMFALCSMVILKEFHDLFSRDNRLMMFIVHDINSYAHTTKIEQEKEADAIWNCKSLRIFIS